MSDLGQQLIKYVRAHAAEKPDFVYNTGLAPDAPGCVYVYDGCASCLIGQALWDAGLIDASFEQNPTNHCPVGSLVDALQLSIDGVEQRWLRTVQYYQDARYTWGDAVRLADEEIPL